MEKYITPNKKELFTRIDSIVDRLIEIDKLQGESEQITEFELLQEVIKDCQKIANNLEQFYDYTEKN